MKNPFEKAQEDQGDQDRHDSFDEWWSNLKWPEKKQLLEKRRDILISQIGYANQIIGLLKKNLEKGKEALEKETYPTSMFSEKINKETKKRLEQLIAIGEDNLIHEEEIKGELEIKLSNLESEISLGDKSFGGA